MYFGLGLRLGLVNIPIYLSSYEPDARDGTGDVEMSNECEEVVLFPLFDHHIVTYHTRQHKVITHDHKP